MIDKILFILVPALVAISLIELFLSSRWNVRYFQTGIVMFKESFRYGNKCMFEGRDATLTQNFKSIWKPSILFHQLSPTEIAFREKMFQFSFFHYTPIMHGIIKNDPSNNTIIVMGHANWFPLCFMTIWLTASIMADFEAKAFSQFSVLFVLLPTLFFTWLYFGQRRIYINICKQIREDYQIS